MANPDDPPHIEEGTIDFETGQPGSPWWKSRGTKEKARAGSCSSSARSEEDLRSG